MHTPRAPPSCTQGLFGVGGACELWEVRDLSSASAGVQSPEPGTRSGPANGSDPSRGIGGEPVMIKV